MTARPWDRPRPLSALPTDLMGSCIYFLMRDGEVVYVGQACCFIFRIVEHMKDTRKAFDSFALEECPRDQLTERDRHYIAKLLP